MVFFSWQDARVFVDDPNPLPVYYLDLSLLDKFWNPRDKVDIRHAKQSTQNAGLVFHKLSFGLYEGSGGGDWTFDVTVSIKPVITCPMDFSWFPFDTQYCYFIMNPTEPYTRLVNMAPYKEGSLPKRQNTQLEYDITLQDLPDHKKKNPSLEEYSDLIDSVWPDLTEEDLALWNDVGVTFKMRRRYRKFVLLYYVPRYPFGFWQLDIFKFSAFSVLSPPGDHS